MAIYTYANVLLVNLLSLLGGISLAWSSSALIRLADINETPLNYVLTEDELSWIVSIFFISVLFGPMITIFIGNNFGRKSVLILLGVIYLISYGVMSFATILALIYVARFFSGVACSASMSAISTYLGEIADNSNRGIIGTSISCFFSLGTVLSLAISPFISFGLFNGLVTAIPCIFVLLMWFYGSETPQYLVLKGDKEKAKKVLRKLKGNATDLGAELNELGNNIKSSENKNITKIILGSIKPIILALLLSAFQQLSGIPQNFAYAETIFNLTNVNLDPSISAIIIGCINLVSTLIAPILVERLGRKMLMIISSGGTFLMHILLGIFFILKEYDIYLESISFLPLLFIAISIITYNIGLGALPLLIAVELCPSTLRTFVTSLASAVIGTVAFLLGKFFYDFENAVGLGGIFMFYGCMCAICTVVCILFLVETKDKSFLDIQNELKK